MQDSTDVVTVAYGERVRALRVEAKLSQQALASSAGLSLRTVSRVEAGEDTTIGTLTAIADVLAVAIAELLAPAAAA